MVWIPCRIQCSWNQNQLQLSRKVWKAVILWTESHLKGSNLKKWSTNKCRWFYKWTLRRVLFVNHLCESQFIPLYLNMFVFWFMSSKTNLYFHTINKEFPIKKYFLKGTAKQKHIEPELTRAVKKTLKTKIIQLDFRIFVIFNIKFCIRILCAC